MAEQSIIFVDTASALDNELVNPPVHNVDQLWKNANELDWLHISGELYESGRIYEFMYGRTPALRTEIRLSDSMSNQYMRSYASRVATLESEIKKTLSWYRVEFFHSAYSKNVCIWVESRQIILRTVSEAIINMWVK